MKKILRLVSIVTLSIILLNSCSNNDNTIIQNPNADQDVDPNPDPDPVEEPTTATKTLINTLSIPWEILWGPDDFLWITERNGKISRIDPDTGEQIEVLTINDVAQVQESGLLGMVIHPNFETNPFVYVAYTYQGRNGLLEKLVRYSYNNNILSNPTILLDDIPANSIHNGARLLITPEPDLKLYMTTGDAGNTNLSQNLNSLAGKLLRINLDGSIPNDNPFTNSYIYSYGHRNAQGLTLHSNGSLYISEHGPSTDDEINRIEIGKNYGWPEVRGIVDTPNEESFAASNTIIESISNWTPTIAPSDLIFYTSNKIPQWTNKLLMTVLKDKQIIALTLNDDGSAILKEEVFFNQEFGRLRDIAVSPTGRVFIATNGNSYTDTSATHKIIEINKIEAQ